MPCRKFCLATNSVYHVFSKSIAEYKIFNSNEEFERIICATKYYQFKSDIKFSAFQNIMSDRDRLHICKSNEKKLVSIVAYCIMPTHLHFILHQTIENGISIFIGNLLNSYTRYFNTKHNRKGPLWESAFKNVPVKTDEQLLHLTRYIHLNPTTAYLADKPEDWQFSSYNEYVQKTSLDRLCEYNEWLSIDSNEYKKITEDQIIPQRELARMKKLLLD